MNELMLEELRLMFKLLKRALEEEKQEEKRAAIRGILGKIQDEIVLQKMM